MRKALYKTIGRRRFDVKLVRQLRYQSQRLHAELFSSFVRAGILSCRSVQKKWQFLNQYGLSRAPASNEVSLPSREFAGFLLDLPGERDPVDDPVALVKNWVQLQPETFHFAHISSERFIAEVKSMLGKRCPGDDGISIA